MKRQAMKRRPESQPAIEHRAAIPVQIEKPIYGGAFLARVDGKATFVPLVLPGEQARVRIVEEKRNYAMAEAEEITQAAAERTTAACRHFGACGGCQYQHATYAAQVAFKRAILRETLERAGVKAPEEIRTLQGEPWGYRNRIRLAVNVQGRLGYRSRRSHSVIAMEECPIAAPLLVRAALIAGETLRKQPGGLQAQEIALFCNAEESELLVSVVSSVNAGKGFEKFAVECAERVPELKGAELTVSGREGEFPRRAASWGRGSLTYRTAGFDYRVDHGSFFQVNRWLVDELAACVISVDEANGQRRIAWDLFAGVGLFARQLVTRYERVVAVESAPTALDALEANLQGTGGRAVRATTLDFLRRGDRGERPDRIVVDPPRTGLGAETVGLLAKSGAGAITYVSCDPATLARDLKALIEAGYGIDRVTLTDLFPQTFHLETVVQLRR